MSSLFIVPNKKEEISNILNKNISGLIIGIENLSTYPILFTIKEALTIAEKTDKEIIISLNLMIHNESLSLVKKTLQEIENSKIKRIIFYDIGVYNIAKEMHSHIEFIINQEHLNASIGSNLFYLESGITSSYITSDITYREILKIKEETGMKIFYNIYGYLPIFYSRRRLLTNYFKYIKKNKDDKLYYIYNNDLEYMIREEEYGTIIYSPLLNLLNKKEELEKIDYLVMDLSFCEDLSIIDKFLNGDRIQDEYLGFYDTKVIYKLRGDSNEDEEN